MRPRGEGFDQEHGTQVRGEGHKKASGWEVGDRSQRFRGEGGEVS